MPSPTVQQITTPPPLHGRHLYIDVATATAAANEVLLVLASVLIDMGSTCHTTAQCTQYPISSGSSSDY